MSYSISTLLTRNLQEVFGENDPARRRAAVQELYTEDGMFYDHFICLGSANGGLNISPSLKLVCLKRSIGNLSAIQEKSGYLLR